VKFPVLRMLVIAKNNIIIRVTLLLRIGELSIIVVYDSQEDKITA